MNKENFIEDFAEILEVDTHQLTMETKYTELEEWDSLAILGFLAMCDSKYSKTVSVEKLLTCTMVSELYELINNS